VQLNPLRIELNNLQGRINNLDGRSQASYNDLAGRQNNCIQAIQSLENRYDNLTTEELTRNMVNQIQTMYPHASNVQAEIELMRRQYSTADARLTDIENNWSSVSGIVARVGHINSKFDSVVGEVANLSQRIKILDDSRERWDEGAEKALEVRVELEKFQDSVGNNAAAKLSAEAATEAANEELVRSVTETTQKLTTEVGNLNEKTLRLVKQVDGQQDAVSILQAAVETVNKNLPTPASIPPWDMKVD
jgi:DNA repair exonuclease SbcCD ATPase subunit